ncbi:hypothetical protein D3C83_147380 [compost metagenome]
MKSPLFGDTKFVASALNFEGMPREIHYASGEPGAQTTEVLKWLGLPDAEIEALRAAGVTQPPAGQKSQAEEAA